jgi:hypothetical protein
MKNSKLFVVSYLNNLQQIRKSLFSYYSKRTNFDTLD